MKSAATRKKPPATPAEWEAVIAAAPGKDRPLTAREEKQMAGAVVVKGGGYAAVRAALAAKRKRGERGPQLAPTK
jgi:NADPH-dependent 2,4-dienoyl-CoA reductase/sulfur reductase-like enzyme